VALAGADEIVVLPVYPARELAADFPGVEGLLVAAATADAAPGRAVAWMPGFDPARAYLGSRLREGDLCLMMGAGHIDSLARSLVP
jgi:UDP-N-acetylmuramate--alanine ligase